MNNILKYISLFLMSLVNANLVTNASIFFNNVTSFSIIGYKDYSYHLEIQGKSINVYSTAFYASLSEGTLPVNHPNSFVTFCLDIDNPVGKYFVYGKFSDPDITYDDAPITRQPGSLQKVGKLYNNLSSGIVDSNGNWISKEMGASLQLAIWEVLYERDPIYDLMAGSFKVIYGSDADIVDYANEIVSTIDSLSGEYDYTFWNATDKAGNPVKKQDIIGPVIHFPEISSLYQFLVFGTLSSISIILLKRKK